MRLLKLSGGIIGCLAGVAGCLIGGAIGYYAFHVRFRFGHGSMGMFEVLLLTSIALLTIMFGVGLMRASWRLARSA